MYILRPFYHMYELECIGTSQQREVNKSYSTPTRLATSLTRTWGKKFQNKPNVSSAFCHHLSVFVSSPLPCTTCIFAAMIKCVLAVCWAHVVGLASPHTDRNITTSPPRCFQIHRASGHPADPVSLPLSQFIYHDKTLRGDDVYIHVSLHSFSDHFRGREIAFGIDSFLANVFYSVLDDIQWHTILIPIGETVYSLSNFTMRSKVRVSHTAAAS